MKEPELIEKETEVQKIKAEIYDLIIKQGMLRMEMEKINKVIQEKSIQLNKLKEGD